MNLTVALDAMGGDFGPSVTVPAALSVLQQQPGARIIVVGDESVLRAQLGKLGVVKPDGLMIHHASQTVEMDDLPSQALRNKKDSSMRVSVNLVKEGIADACVSAGNTGALMAVARFVLKTLPGVDRPAIVSSLPAVTGHTHMLDLGANVESTPRQLFEFAVMGSVLASAVDSIPRPRVGLLNIGEEEMKGNERVKEAAQLLAGSDIHYIGFVEGDDIFKGTADVIVCDGFVGNVALKASEGLAKLITGHVRREFSRNALTRLVALLALPVVKASRRRFDPRRYNGATLIGLRSIVVKSHGSADQLEFANAIRAAIAEVEKKVPERISEHLASLLAEREAV